MEIKLPPQAKEIEASILGAVMIVPNAIEKVIPVLKVDDFYSPMHQQIYSAILKIHAKGEAVDLMTVSITLKDKVDPFEITKLTNSVMGDAHMESWCRVVKDKSQLRRIANITAEYNAKVYNEDEHPSEILGGLMSLISGIMHERQSKEVRTMEEVILEAMTEMDEASARGGDLVGAPGCLRSVNELTLGYAAPDLTIIAAGTSEGKSTLMLNDAIAAAEAGWEPIIFSLEMANVQLMYKILSNKTDISVQAMRRGSLTENERSSLHKSVSKDLSKLGIKFYDRGGLSIQEFKAIVKNHVANSKKPIAYLDYLQLMTTTGSPVKFSNRESEVNYISKELKATCKNENIAIVALSQLSRLKEKRMYVKSDLRESGAIEQDADRVMFIYRPKYHKIDTDENGNAFLESDCFIQIEKERLGQTGIIKANFYGQYSRFTDDALQPFKRDYEPGDLF